VLKPLQLKPRRSRYRQGKAIEQIIVVLPMSSFWAIHACRATDVSNIMHRLANAMANLVVDSGAVSHLQRERLFRAE